jgi:hypothetical protein
MQWVLALRTERVLALCLCESYSCADVVAAAVLKRCLYRSMSRVGVLPEADLNH